MYYVHMRRYGETQEQLSIGAYIATAHEDMPMARTIYQGVWTHGIELQLHVENLMIGHNPKFATFKAIEASAVLILYLSEKSLDPHGELKYELRAALDFGEQKPIIGVVADRSLLSRLPAEFSAITWIDISEPAGFQHLANALKALQERTAVHLVGKANGTEPPLLFISYSHVDEPYCDKLVKHLSSLKREGLIRIWHDRALTPGSQFDQEIENQLSESDLVIILVSADFIASEYCFSKEMLKAMEDYKYGYGIVVPVIIRPVDWTHTPFGNLLALPKDGKPVVTWQDEDEAFVDVVNGIRRLLRSEHHISGHRA